MAGDVLEISARSGGEEPLDRAAQESKEIEKQESGEHEERGDDDGGRDRVRRGHPGKPNGQEVFSKTKHPIAERFGAGIDRGARACFRAVRGERYATREQGCAPSPFSRRGGSGRVSKKSGGGRADESVNRVPKGVHVGHFVGEEFEKVEHPRDSEDPGMGKNFERGWKMDYTVALEKAERRNRGIEIQAGRKSSAESETESFDRIHGFILAGSRSAHVEQTTVRGECKSQQGARGCKETPLALKKWRGLVVVMRPG